MVKRLNKTVIGMAALTVGMVIGGQTVVNADTQPSLAGTQIEQGTTSSNSTSVVVDNEVQTFAPAQEVYDVMHDKANTVYDFGIGPNGFEQYGVDAPDGMTYGIRADGDTNHTLIAIAKGKVSASHVGSKLIDPKVRQAIELLNNRANKIVNQGSNDTGKSIKFLVGTPDGKAYDILKDAKTNVPEITTVVNTSEVALPWRNMISFDSTNATQTDKVTVKSDGQSGSSQAVSASVKLESASGRANSAKATDPSASTTKSSQSVVPSNVVKRTASQTAKSSVSAQGTSVKKSVTVKKITPPAKKTAVTKIINVHGILYKNNQRVTGVVNSKQYISGKLANGQYKGVTYKNGKALTGINATDGLMYKSGKLLTGTYNRVRYLSGAAQAKDMTPRINVKDKFINKYGFTYYGYTNASGQKFTARQAAAGDRSVHKELNGKHVASNGSYTIVTPHKLDESGAFSGRNNVKFGWTKVLKAAQYKTKHKMLNGHSGIGLHLYDNKNKYLGSIERGTEPVTDEQGRWTGDFRMGRTTRSYDKGSKNPFFEISE